MPPKPDSQKPKRPNTKPPSNQLSARTYYLIAYNSISAILWLIVLDRVVRTALLKGPQHVHKSVGEFARWTQTLAGLEVVHSLVGIVRAPVLTTVMQVASRFLLVWGIVFLFPVTTTNTIFYSTMLLAWSTTEVIRYGYFAVNLAYGRVPELLSWLRYNTFFVLYPLGISSECYLVWLAQEPARKAYGDIAVWALRAVLAVYVPGSYILFTHMMKQRRKIMSGTGSKRSK